MGDMAYRVWDLLKQRVLAEESFPDEDLSKLDVRLEPDGDDSMVVHVGRNDVKLVGIAFSVDGVRWGDVREVGNHEVPFDQGKEKTAMCLHLPAWVLHATPNPWIEVDIPVGLTIAHRRFRYRADDRPVPGDFPLRDAAPARIHLLGKTPPPVPEGTPQW